MASGSNYVRNPVYESVKGNSTSTYDTTIPSGHVPVAGWYYYHNDNGFTGAGWFTSIHGGPTYMFLSANPNLGIGSTLEERMSNYYVSKNGNLTEMFNWWEQHYTNDGAKAFEDGVWDVNQSCMSKVV